MRSASFLPMLYFFQNNVVPQYFNGMVCWHYHRQWICGYVHVYKIIKQLLHACSGNRQNNCPSVLEMTWKLLPSASGNSSQVISSTSGQSFWLFPEQAWNNCIILSWLGTNKSINSGGVKLVLCPPPLFVIACHFRNRQIKHRRLTGLPFTLHFVSSFHNIFRNLLVSSVKFNILYFP